MNNKYIINRENIFVDMIDENIMINTQAGDKLYALGAVESRIWQCLESGMSLEDLIKTLAQEYSASANTIKEDIESFLDELIGAELLFFEEDGQANGNG